MCYEAFVDGDVTERLLSTLLHEEIPDALGNGAVTAVLVASVLFASGVGTATTAGMAVAAVGPGAAVHLVALVLGARVLRYRTGDATNAGAERPV